MYYLFHFYIKRALTCLSNSNKTNIKFKPVTAETKAVKPVCLVQLDGFIN